MPSTVMVSQLKTAIAGLSPAKKLTLVVLVVVGWSWGMVVRRRPGATGAEAVQAVVVLLATAFVVLTIIGVWFRGEGMALIWPWSRGGG